jgi:hypothetical protein
MGLQDAGALGSGIRLGLRVAATPGSGSRLGLRVAGTPGSRSDNTNSEDADALLLVLLDPSLVIALTKDKDDE